ncbi:kelch-like protein 10 [Acanthochromis polyacanthus]|uniref:kelch-like protein 10 n=1 Tax=Acanthochromis polyacanthus TaxID=80966 RepID=UPI002233FA84|nr:kelch-like protein 10 [Acanthochromis polyacanthus]
MMQLIIEFAYTDSVCVTKENVQELLMAADQFNVMGIIEACSDFIGEQLCSENCINIWRFTKICISPKLQLKAYRYITDHFEDVIGCDEFLELSVEEFIDFLDRDDLNVREESTVCEAVMRWIRHEPAERLGHIGDLLWKVRLALMSEDYITNNLQSNELLENNRKCQTLINAAKNIVNHLVTYGPSPCGLFNRLARPRLPNAILLATGGFSSGDPTNCIKAYDFKANDWIDITNHLEDPLSYHGAVFLDGYVYCIGGFERMEYINTVRRFDLKTRTWQEVGPMHCRRCYMSVAVLNGCIYAMGGYDGNTRLNSAECYYPDTNKWTEIAPMFEQRSHASGTTLDEKIYICGGYNGNECLEMAEYYIPEVNQWTRIAPMTIQRGGVGVIAYAGHVFAVGGSDGSNHHRTTEAYNPLTNTWTEVSSMINPRSNFGIEVLDRRIFAVGGFTGFTNTCKVEYYDITTNEWTEAHDMNISRTGLSCCVIYGLPNMAEYAVPRDLPLALVEEMEWESSGSN